MPQPLCPHAADCGLARSIAMEAALHVWESFYCEGFFGRCERYRLRGAGQEVPGRLLPNGRLLDVPEDRAPATSRNDLQPDEVAPPLRRLA